jgi:hypothetical protein
MLTSKHRPPEFRPGIEIAEPDIYGRTRTLLAFGQDNRVHPGQPYKGSGRLRKTVTLESLTFATVGLAQN